MESEKKYALILFIFLFLLNNSLCFADAGKAKDESALLGKIPRMSCEQALTLYNAGKIILIDVHLKKSEKSIIWGALNLPYGQIQSMNIKLPKNKIIACF